MLNKNFLENINDESKLEMRATREGFGDALLSLGGDYENVVALCADLTESTQMHKFKEKYPERFFQMGVAEQNMAAVASGMSAMGTVPFIASYAMFSPGRNWEQIRTTICYNNRKVIIVGAHAGLSVGPDGGTHQAIEDIAILRAIPNIKIFSPADYHEAYSMTRLAVEVDGPVYIRLAREKSPVIFDKDYNAFKSANSVVYNSHNQNSMHKVGIIATGPIISEAVKAAKILEHEHNIKVSIMNMSIIKEVDENEIIRFAHNNKKIITLEEHQIVGGLGSLVSEILGQHLPTKIKRVGVKNRFGQSGKMSELYREYEIDAQSIVAEVLNIIHSH